MLSTPLSFPPSSLTPPPYVCPPKCLFRYTARQAKKRKLWADRGGRLGHDLRFVASAVSHLFSAFGDLLDLYRRFADMSGLISRVAELKEELQALQEQHDMDEVGILCVRPDCLLSLHLF